MKDCLDEATKLDYLNALLSESERARFEKHLETCPECRLEIAGLQKTREAVTGLTLPPVPEAWTAEAKERLHASRRPGAALSVVERVYGRGKTKVFQYAAIAAGVTAGLVLLFWLVLGGAVQHLSPGTTSASALLPEPADLVLWILALHALVLVPSIIENLYQLLQRRSRRRRPELSVAETS